VSPGQIERRRSILGSPADGWFAAVAQLVEHILGKDEVTSSSLVSSFVFGGRNRRKKRRTAIVFSSAIGDNYRGLARSQDRFCGDVVAATRVLVVGLGRGG